MVLTTKPGMNEVRLALLGLSMSIGDVFYLDEMIIREGTDPTFVPSAGIVGNADMRATVRLAPYTGAWRTFISTAGIGTGLHFRQGETTPVLEALHSDGDWREGSGDVDLPSDEWIDVQAAVTLGDAFRFYIDGTPAGETPCTADAGVPDPTMPICVGAYIGGTHDQFMEGAISSATIRDGIDGPIVAEFDANDIMLP
jgi:hypothetical protein